MTKEKCSLSETIYETKVGMTQKVERIIYTYIVTFRVCKKVWSESVGNWERSTPDEKMDTNKFPG